MVDHTHNWQFSKWHMLPFNTIDPVRFPENYNVVDVIQFVCECGEVKSVLPKKHIQ